MIAKGYKEPTVPYFFIQEFKPSFTNSRPDDQLLAELMVAMEKNEESVVRGAYINRQHWFFTILEKKHDGSYQYAISKSFDSIDFEDLKAVYKHLQTVKSSLLDN